MLEKEKSELDQQLKTQQASVTKLTKHNTRMKTLVQQATDQLLESKQAAQRQSEALKAKKQQIVELKELTQRQLEARNKPPTIDALEKLHLKSVPIAKVMIPTVNQVWCCLSTSALTASGTSSVSTGNVMRRDTQKQQRGGL